MSFIRNLAVKIGLSERRKNERVPARGLEVSYWTGLEQKRARIKDISPTGIYLQANDHWLPGSSVVLTLQRKGLLERDFRLQVRLRARAVRFGNDGVGLVFVHEHIDTSAWVKLMARATTLIAHKDAVRLFRVTKAFAFLLRICPSAETQILKLIPEEMSSERAERAIEIVLQAEELLVSQNCTAGRSVDSSLLLHLLVEGSKAHDEQTRHCWAGLLATSSLDGSDEEESLSFVDLLSKLDSVHIPILAAAATRAMQAGWKPGLVFSQSLHCTANEIKKITGRRNLAQIERDLVHMHDLGLLEQTIKKILLAHIEEANITPTSLGLNFYARCSGQVEVPEAYANPKTELEIAS